MKPAANILVVDDETPARELLARGLSRLGYRVTTATDGVTATALLHLPWEVIVTDLMMPRMDGLTLLGEINRLCPRTMRVVMTSFADKDRVVAALNLGTDYLLEKPFGVERLAGVLDQLLSERDSSSSDEPMAQFLDRRLDNLPLTPRERQVVALVLKGRSNRELAAELGQAEQTVKNLLSQIYGKLGVQSRSELFGVIFPV